MNLIRKQNTWYPSIMDDFFNANWNFDVPNYSHSLPAVNIKEADKEFTLQIASPGLTKEDFEVSFEDNVLSYMEEQTKLQREMKRILSFFYWFTIISIVISLIGIFFI